MTIGTALRVATRPTGALARVLGGDSGIYLAATLASYVLSTTTNLLTARLLGPDGKGMLTLAVTCATFGSVLGLFGLDASMSRAIARGGVARRQAFLALRAAVISTASAAGLFAAAILLGVSGGSDVAPVLLIATACVAATGAATPVVLGALASLRRRRALFVSRVGGAAVVLTASLVVLSLDRSVAPLVGAVAVGGALTLFLAARHLRDVTHDKSDARALRPLLRSGLRVHLGSIVLTMSYRLDFVLVGVVLGPAALGLYGVAVSTTEVLLMVADSNSVSLLQRASSALADGSWGNARQALRSALLRTTALMGAGAVAIIATGWFLIPLFFGAPFSDAYIPALLLLPGTLALGMSKNLVTFLLSAGHDYSHLVAAASGLAVALPSTLILMPYAGLEGAAVAATIGYSTSLLAAVAFSRLAARVRSGGDQV